MEPITWKNVNGPSLDGAYRPLLAASHMFGSATDGLMKILDDRNATNKANYTQEQNNNYAAQIAKLRSFATPEALAEAQKTNAFDAANAALLGTENAAKFQVELANAPTKLMQQKVAQDQYGEHTLTQQQKPIVEAFLTDLTNGQFKNAASRLDTNSLVNEAALRDKLALAMEKQEQRERQAKQDARQIRQDAQNSAEHSARMNQFQKATVADNLLNSTLGQFNKDNLAYRANAVKVAKELGLPVNQAGNPELYGLNENTLKAYQARVGAAPNPVDYEQGLIQGAVTNGIAGSAGALTKAFTAAASGVNIGGKDDPALVRAIELIDTRKKLAREQNVFYADKATAEKDKEAVLAAFSGIKGKYWFHDKPQQKVADLLEKGLTMTDSNGKEQTVTITPKLAELAMKMTPINKESEWWRHSSSEQFERNLKTLLKNPVYQKQLTELEDLNTGASFTAQANALRRQFRAFNPQELDSYLTSALDKASAKALEVQNKAVSGGK